MSEVILKNTSNSQRQRAEAEEAEAERLGELLDNHVRQNDLYLGRNGNVLPMDSQDFLREVSRVRAEARRLTKPPESEQLLAERRLANGDMQLENVGAPLAAYVEAARRVVKWRKEAEEAENRDAARFDGIDFGDSDSPLRKECA